jgi:hypothetical protein
MTAILSAGQTCGLIALRPVFFGKLDMSARQRWQGAAREIFY